MAAAQAAAHRKLARDDDVLTLILMLVLIHLTAVAGFLVGRRHARDHHDRGEAGR